MFLFAETFSQYGSGMVQCAITPGLTGAEIQQLHAHHQMYWCMGRADCLLVGHRAVKVSEQLQGPVNGLGISGRMGGGLARSE